jgi:hypothetical protein
MKKNTCSIGKIDVDLEKFGILGLDEQHYFAVK